MKNTVDSFYVLYVLSTGIIDDVKDIMRCLTESDWMRLPLQVHIISIAPSHLKENDQDSQQLLLECNRINLEKSGWPQFNIHFYDRIKTFTRGRVSLALERLRQDCVHRVTRDIESYLFRNNIDLSKYSHNKSLTNATQSQQYVMDLIDKKFEKLKDQIYKLGIKPIQFRNMVEGHALIEWSPEVGLALNSRFSSWVVQEDDAENQVEETEDGKSNMGGRSSFNSMHMQMDKSERAASSSSAIGVRTALPAEAVYRTASNRDKSPNDLTGPSWEENKTKSPKFLDVWKGVDSLDEIKDDIY